jgi:hypothetical protein
MGAPGQRGRDRRRHRARLGSRKRQGTTTARRTPASRTSPPSKPLARAHTGHRGASKLLKTLDAHEPGTSLTRSELEERFLAICRQHDLPHPLVNHDLAGRERDFVFPDHRLVVEVDSWTYHRSRRAFETDRYRDQTLLVAGYRTLRITDTQLEYDPPGVAATLTAVLR